VKGVAWPELLTLVDDLPPATIVTSVRNHANHFVVRGVTHDNGVIRSVTVNGQTAKLTICASHDRATVSAEAIS
jgi:hypothetical protein